MRLTRASYMSPQDPSFRGQGFACNNCDFFNVYQSVAPHDTVTVLKYDPNAPQTYQFDTPTGPQCIHRGSGVSIGVNAPCS